MPDLESLIIAAVINFLIKWAVKIIERLAVVLFKKINALVRRDSTLESQKDEATVADNAVATAPGSVPDAR